MFYNIRDIYPMGRSSLTSTQFPLLLVDFRCILLQQVASGTVRGSDAPPVMSKAAILVSNIVFCILTCSYIKDAIELH